MAYLYPNGDTQQLNLSWFLAKFKELYEYVMNLDPGEASMDTILSRFTDQYNPTTTYVAGDYCIFDGYIYKANQTTSGMFNSGAWDPALPVNDIQGLRILISQLSQTVQDLGEDAVTDVQYTPGAATANGLLRKTINGSASTVMTVDKEPTQNSQNPVKSGSVYEELTELKGSLNSKCLYLTGIACSATTGNFVDYSNSAITTSHVLAECVFANPAAITTDVTWNTDTAGKLIMNGTCTTATTVNVVLIKKDN